MLHLEDVLERLYDSEINITITWLVDGGFDFTLHSYMSWPEIGTPLDDLESVVDPKPRMTPPAWHSCEKASELAEAIHQAALRCNSQDLTLHTGPTAVVVPVR
jgi:hypothetical protein